MQLRLKIDFSDSKCNLLVSVKFRLIFFPEESFLTISYMVEDVVVVFPSSKTSTLFIWWIKIKSKSVAVMVNRESLASKSILERIIIVVWSLFENSLPISGNDFEVKIFVRYIAVCLGLTKYLDLLDDNISFLLILKNLQTIVWIKSIVTLFSLRLSKSFNTIFVSAKFGILL